MNVYRWLIPLGLGLVAGVSHYFVLQGATRTVPVLVAAGPLKPGDQLTEDRISIIEIRLDGPPQYLDANIPVSARYRFIGFPVRRAIGPGEPILRADVSVEAQQIDLRDDETLIRLIVAPEKWPKHFDTGTLLKLRPPPPTRDPGSTVEPTPYRFLGLAGESRSLALAVKAGDPLLRMSAADRSRYASSIQSIDVIKPRSR